MRESKYATILLCFASSEQAIWELRIHRFELIVTNRIIPFLQNQQLNTFAAWEVKCRYASMDSHLDDRVKWLIRPIGFAPRRKFSGKYKFGFRSCVRIKNFPLLAHSPFRRCKAKVCVMKGTNELRLINLEHNHMKKLHRRAKGEVDRLIALRKSAQSTKSKRKT